MYENVMYWWTRRFRLTFRIYLTWVFTLRSVQQKGKGLILHTDVETVKQGLTSWLSFLMSNFEVVTFTLVSWVRCCAGMHRFLTFAIFLTFTMEIRKKIYMVMTRKCHNYTLQRPRHLEAEINTSNSPFACIFNATSNSRSEIAQLDSSSCMHKKFKAVYNFENITSI